MATGKFLQPSIHNQFVEHSNNPARSYYWLHVFCLHRLGLASEEATSSPYHDTRDSPVMMFVQYGGTPRPGRTTLCHAGRRGPPVAYRALRPSALVGGQRDRATGRTSRCVLARKVSWSERLRQLCLRSHQIRAQNCYTFPLSKVQFQMLSYQVYKITNR